MAFVIALVLVLSAAAGGDRPSSPPDPFVPEAGGSECRRCHDTGVVVCRECAKDPCPADERLLYCSVAAGCRDCSGTGKLPCTKCDAELPDELGERAGRLAAWREGMGEIDDFMGRALHHAESEHFVLTYDFRRLDVKGAGRPHPGMHLYLERLEAHYDDFVRDVSAREGQDFSAKTRVLLWDQQRDQERASPRYTRQSSKTESKLMGAEPVVSIYYDKDHLHEEFEMHQALVHQVTHCLLSNVFDGIWPGNIGAGWIDAGLAHHYEVANFGGVRHYCYVESDTIRRFKFGRWEPTVRAAVAKDEALSILGVAGKHTGSLTPEEHMYAWSFVDFLLREHPGKFGPLARGLKAKRPLREVLQEVLGTTPFQFDEAWRAFVLERYSPRKR